MSYDFNMQQGLPVTKVLPQQRNEFQLTKRHLNKEVPLAGSDELQSSLHIIAERNQRKQIKTNSSQMIVPS